MADEIVLCEVPLAAPLSDWAATAVRTRLLWMSPAITGVRVTPDAVRVFAADAAPRPDLAREVRSGVEQLLSTNGHAVRSSAALLSHAGGAQRMEVGEVHARLAESGELTELGPGMYGYTGDLLRLVRALAARLTAVGGVIGAREYMYPTVVDLEVAHRAKYLEKFPHHMFLLSHFEQDVEKLDRVSAAARGGESAAQVLAREGGSVARPRWIANPLGCYQVFQQLSGKRLASAGLSAFVAAGRCMRFEAAGTEGLCRLSNYTLVETVAVGSRADVLSARESVLARTAQVAQWLDLSFEVRTASDPFFRVEDANLGLLQQLAGLKYELMVDVPGRARPLAVSSFNLHGDAFTRAFDITGPHEPMASCCTGCGVERWAVSVLCRHGLDPRDWPAGWDDAEAPGQADRAAAR